ncbi:MAG: hypothetical protein AAB133_03010 [Pseudomonadota bacterium]
MATEIFTQTSIAFLTASPHAAKHTGKTGAHAPIDLHLLADMITGLFSDKLDIRQGDKIPATSIQSVGHSAIYFELNSQTSDASCFREMGANLYPNGTCTVKHLLEHHDTSRFARKNVELKKCPYFYVIKESSSE